MQDPESLICTWLTMLTTKLLTNPTMRYSYSGHDVSLSCGHKHKSFWALWHFWEKIVKCSPKPALMRDSASRKCRNIGTNFIQIMDSILQICVINIAGAFQPRDQHQKNLTKHWQEWEASKQATSLSQCAHQPYFPSCECFLVNYPSPHCIQLHTPFLFFFF